MLDSIDLLIHLLHHINSDDSIQVTNDIYDRSNPLVSAVIYIANDILISEDGHPDRDNMNKVTLNGYPISPGETDRFGWLTACIELSRGIIVFG
jgi:hypothetical protein